MDAVRAALVRAIQKGVPAYNGGAPDVCRDIYAAAARGVVDARIAPQHVADALSAAASSAGQKQDPGEAAWTLRRCFDAILDGRLDVATRVPAGAPEVMILNFEAGLPPLPRWSSVDDGVMGGLSSSTLTWDPHEQAAVFKGELTTANNGGFASMRSSAWPGYAELSGAHGVRLLVRGDGRTYKLSAKADDGYDGVMYQHDFVTADDRSWTAVDLLFSNFKPNFRGQFVAGRPPLSGSQVRQLGIMVSKFSDAGGLTPGFRTGPFRLALRSIRGIFL